MRWRSLDHYAKSDWHEWFAWYPVRVNSTQMAWFEKVKRKGYYSGWAEYKHWKYEYDELG